jgi:succinate dehydrogenase/fumarate reductase flavoprotein subunit
MFKNIFLSIAAGTAAMFLVTACAEESEQTTQAQTMEASVESNQQEVSIMQQPVDFSTPEAVENTLQAILEKEGDTTYRQIKNAMQYIMVYDLSLGKNEEKLHKKLNGRTPEQVIAKMKR